MTDNRDGIIRIETNPEDDINYIQGLPPEERKYALKYWSKSFKKDLKLMFYSIDEFGKAILEANGIHIPSVEKGFEILFRKKKNPLWPKTEKGKLEWKSIYADMCSLDRMYAKEFRKPTNKDYADFLSGKKKKFGYKGKSYSDRILQEVKRAAEEGFLESV